MCYRQGYEPNRQKLSGSRLLYGGFIPRKGVRFIAISNGVDSTHSESNEFAPFLNIMNEWHVRDTSRKIKSVLRNKGMEGKHLTSNAIYGYKKDPEDNNHWLVDGLMDADEYKM